MAKAAGRLSGVGPPRACSSSWTTGRGHGARARTARPCSRPTRCWRCAGRRPSLLEAERTALNFLAHLSGVATLTARFVARRRRARARASWTRARRRPACACSRRRPCVHGGGSNHRIGLFDEVLLKENHFAMGGRDHAAHGGARSRRPRRPACAYRRGARPRRGPGRPPTAARTYCCSTTSPSRAWPQAVAQLERPPAARRLPARGLGGVNLETVGRHRAHGRRPHLGRRAHAQRAGARPLDAARPGAAGRHRRPADEPHRLAAPHGCWSTAAPEPVRALRSLLASFLRDRCVPDDVVRAVVLAFGEALDNAWRARHDRRAARCACACATRRAS